MNTCKDCEYFDEPRNGCEHPDGKTLAISDDLACELFESNWLDFYSIDIKSFLAGMPKKMEQGKVYEWQCGCGGIARCFRSLHNGHIWAYCKKCELSIIQ